MKIRLVNDLLILLVTLASITTYGAVANESQWGESAVLHNHGLDQGRATKSVSVAKPVLKGAKHLSPTEILVSFSSLPQALLKSSLLLFDHLGNRIPINAILLQGLEAQITTATLDLTKNYCLRMGNDEIYVYLSRELLNFSDYIYDGDDLGATLRRDGAVQFKLWSPSAVAVGVEIFDHQRSLGIFPLTRTSKGVWQALLEPSYFQRLLEGYDGYFYQYHVSAYGKSRRVLDPYAKSMGEFAGDYTKAHSELDLVGKAAIVDISNQRKAGEVSHFSNAAIMASSIDMIAYEIHVRDFTIAALDVAPHLRGTYLGFIEKIPYLKDLGITHVQLLPVQNHFRVREIDRSSQNKNNPIPNYNWGYDPHNYFTAEGWYASQPESPYVRVRELRELIRALHEAGIGVILDVVYNHTYQLSTLNDAAPGLYYREPGGATPVGDPAVETRNPMVRKLIIDSLKHFVNEYGVSGFRFDLMGFMDNTTMREIRKELGDDVILYGEAWNFTDLVKDEAPIKGLFDSYPHDINLGLFNDTVRDSFTGSHASKGFVQGALFEAPRVKAGIIAGIKGFTNAGSYVDIDDDDYNIFAAGPDETLQYLTCHDGFTLWDKINLSYDGSPTERALLARQAAAMLFTSQGKILFQGGMEIGRTKPLAPADPERTRAHTSGLWNEDEDVAGIKYFHENSYRSSDYTNMMRWERANKEPFAQLLNYHKGLIKMRRSIAAFRYPSADAINRGLKFIGETRPTISTPEPLYRSFAQIPELIIRFINGPVEATYFLAGEIHSGDQNPLNNPYFVTFDRQGAGQIHFTKAQIQRFDLEKWGATQNLNFKLVLTPGDWSSIPGAYSATGNTRIKPTAVLVGNIVVVDLSLPDHVPGEAPKDYQSVIAYELDNQLDMDGAAGDHYSQLIVIHNVGTTEVEVASLLITLPSEWSVILDQNSAGITAISPSMVKIALGTVTVPGHSSAVIAKK